MRRQARGIPGPNPGRNRKNIMENMKKYAIQLAALFYAASNSGEETTTTQILEPVATIL